MRKRVTVGFTPLSRLRSGRDTFSAAGRYAICPRDCVVDLARDAALVYGNAHPSHVGRSRRARRKWKNSTPSRKRRFIISGLVSISARMDAIFEGRK